MSDVNKNLSPAASNMTGETVKTDPHSSGSAAGTDMMAAKNNPDELATMPKGKSNARLEETGNPPTSGISKKGQQKQMQRNFI